MLLSINISLNLHIKFTNSISIALLYFRIKAFNIDFTILYVQIVFDYPL